MVNVYEEPRYTRLVNRTEISQIKGHELAQVLALFTTTLGIGVERSEKEQKRVITEGIAVLNSFPDAKEAAKDVLGNDWFNSVFVSMLTSD
jgi:hypothetical protein